MSASRQFSDGRRDRKAPENSTFAQTCNLLSQYIKEKGSLRDLNLEIGDKVESLEAIVKPGSSLAASSSPEKQRRTADPIFRQPELDSSVVVIDDSSNKASTSKEGKTGESKAAQLTIFYSGRVLVFDDYPMDKVRELVSIAKRGSSQMSYGIFTNTHQEKQTTSAAVVPASREGLPPRPRPQPAAGGSKQCLGISSNSCKEKGNSNTNGNLSSSSSSRGKEHEVSTSSETSSSDLPIARRSSLHRFLEKRKDRAAVRGPYQNQEHPGSSSSSKGDESLIDLNI